MFNKHKAGQKGQSTVEYIVLVTAVIAVAIAFLVPKNSGFQKKMGGSLNTVADQMDSMATRLANSTN